MQLSARAEMLAAALERACPGAAPLAVAVSGGGDSLALLLAAAARAGASGPAVSAVTVDHGLRPEAATEARRVAEICATRGIPHDILVWQGWDGQGNLQAAARQARLRLIAYWARDRDIGRVALAHTRDDQAETVLMRLARGAGVDGLAGMAPERRAGGVSWLRPFLGIPRADLRSYLEECGQDWIEDPSNDDRRFERVRVRQALELLRPVGIGAAGLAATATRLASARAALDAATAEAAARLVREEAGDLLIEAGGLAALPEEIARRLVLAGLGWVSGAGYPPRARGLEAALSALMRGPRATLHGCLLQRARGRIRIGREPAAVAGLSCAPGTLWDGRWRLSGPADAGSGEGAPEGLEIRALGAEGLAACPDWRAAGLPRTTLIASPSVWQGGALIAAPLAGYGKNWSAAVNPSFTAHLLSH
ncbi:tRNA lysidine(34) synthetase TilS [Rhodovulum sp. MB263]|uniref:tRNA lysidine(34) synthetase TilS n=1 Tax=Rhodovulum sp. (strain MB263) TaxID=308754 RepID=UPI001E451674|nr:tRNA lysidine(34) synthetase TilS [Rhodovulum sp. MB263]